MLRCANVDQDPVLALNDESFDERVRALDGPILVDFWAPWCAPCKVLAATLDELVGELAGVAHFARVNVDESGDLVNRFGIRSVPTLIVFKGGKIVDQLVGAAPKEKVRRMIARHLPDVGWRN